MRKYIETHAVSSLECGRLLFPREPGNEADCYSGILDKRCHGMMKRTNKREISRRKPGISEEGD